MKRTALALTLMLTILLSAVGWMLFVNFAVAVDAGDILASSPHAILIESPNNYTIYKNTLLLNFNVTYLYYDTANVIVWQYVRSLSYSIDSKPLVSIFNLTGDKDVHISSQSILLDVSELSDGQHKIEVTAVFVGCINQDFVPTYTLTSAPVYFTVYNTSPPVISNLSPENKTYDKIDVQISFTVDRPTSWIGYSLDGKGNITVAGNTTLTGLSYGSHTLTIYANDTVGNIGASQTINFTIAKETEPFPTALVATASAASVAVIGVGLLVYFRKRNH